MDYKREKSSLSFPKKLFIAVLTFFFLVLLMASFFGKKGLVEINRAQKEQRDLIQEKERLERGKIKLEKEIEALEMDPKSVEKKAREKLWLMKPEEKVLIIEEK
jgi:cell division protein FtsB